VAEAKSPDLAHRTNHLRPHVDNDVSRHMGGLYGG
jgi:hypothetical protein